MKKQFVYQGIKVMLILALSMSTFGCGSSSDDTSPAPIVDPSTLEKTGVFLDAPVSGVAFSTTSGLGGITNTSGEFRYIDGDEVIFSFGDVVFPSVIGAEIVTPLQMGATNDLTDQTVINILRLLQTLDSDGDPSNGIEIDPLVVDRANFAIDFSQNDADFENAVQLFLSSLAGNRGLVASDVAKEHFESSLFTQMAGLYRGTFSGDGSGTWQFTIDTAGNLTGSAVNSDPSDGTETFSGTVLSDGRTTVGIVGGDGTFTGTISLTGDISGTWASNDPPESGTFTGKKEVQVSTEVKFDAATVPGTYSVEEDGRPGVLHIYTFNANGSGVINWGDDPEDENFTWSVDAQGRLIMFLGNNGPGTLADRATLTSGTINGGRFNVEVDDNEDGVYDVQFVGSITKQ